MEHERLFAFCLIVVSLFWALPEAGYGYGKTWLGRDLGSQIENARFSLGPFRVRTNFTLSNAGYDSNVYYGATDQPIKDLTFTAGSAFDIYLPLKKKIIFHIYDLPSMFTTKKPRERTWNNFFKGEVHLIASEKGKRL